MYAAVKTQERNIKTVIDSPETNELWEFVHSMHLMFTHHFGKQPHHPVHTHTHATSTVVFARISF